MNSHARTTCLFVEGCAFSAIDPCQHEDGVEMTAWTSRPETSESVHEQRQIAAGMQSAGMKYVLP